MKIGLFGGSFDPVHEGHLALARTVAEALSLDRVRLIPTGQPPHKLRHSQTADAQRLAMCRLAVAEDPLFEVSDYEIQKGGASFTIDTVEAFCAAEPDTRFYLLMGADMFLTLTTWKRFADLAARVTFCTVPRDDVPVSQLRDYAATLESYGATCFVAEAPLKRISSTQIRRRVRDGLPLDGLVPSSVGGYIAQNGLYREDGAADPYAQYKAILQARLRPDRYEHSLCVADEAKRLALRWGVDPEKAYTAGLLHDIMKHTKHEQQLQILKDFGILLDAVAHSSPKLWHAISGAAYVEKLLGVDDPEIVSAIRYHTTGRAAMTPMERVLFLADFTSADRDYDDVDVMRRLVDEDPDAAMRYALSYTVRELARGGSPIHPDTIAAYNELALKRSVNLYGKGQTQQDP